MGINLRVPQNSVKVDGRNSSIYLAQNAIKGDDGGYYIPSIDSEGNLTWAPSETEMPAVGGTNIKGPKGDSGVWVGTETPDGDYNVWVKPDDEAIEIATKADLDGKQDKLTAGTNITIENNVISAAGGGADEVWIGSEEPTGDQTVWIDPTGSETAGLVTQAELANKQDKLTAGTNITIDSNNVISATGSSYTLPKASKDTLGGVKIDDKTIKIGPYGTIYSVTPIANSVEIGGVKPDDKTIKIDQYGTISVDKSQVEVSYTLPAASWDTLGGVKVMPTEQGMTTGDSFINISADTNLLYVQQAKSNSSGVVQPDNETITIKNGVISATGPAQYIKSASATENTLNLHYNDGTSVVFTPTGGSGGGSGGVSGYAFSSTQTLTDADKAHLKEIYINKNIYMTIDNLTVVRIMSLGSRWGFVVINTNGATSNQVLVYTVDIDGSGNVTSNTFTLFISYYLVGNSSQLTGDIITSENWNQYISVSGGGGADWSVTASTSDSNLYNTKEVVIFWQDYSYNRHQSYLNVGCDYYGNSGQTWGTSNWLNTEIRLDSIDDVYNGCSIIYDGSNINTANIASINAILYKT